MKIYSIQSAHEPTRQGEIVTAIREDNGQPITGECYFTPGRPFSYRICEDHHERVSHGHLIKPFSITKPTTTH